MRTRQLGPLEVSTVGLGCNDLGPRIGGESSRMVVEAAIDAGITLFDTADVHGDGSSEEMLGEVLREHRDEVVIATKFGHRTEDPPEDGGTDRWVREALEDSLRRLGVDHVDLFQMQRSEADVPLPELLGALHELVEAGKTRAIGCAGLGAEDVDAAARAAEEEGITAFVSVQRRYSILHRDPEDDGLTEACERLGVGLLPYFPLESGLLAGHGDLDEADLSGEDDALDTDGHDDRLSSISDLTDLAEQHGRTLPELAIAWLVAQPTVASVITGATGEQQVRDNVAAAGWDLDDEVLDAVERIVRG